MCTLKGRKMGRKRPLLFTTVFLPGCMLMVGSLCGVGSPLDKKNCKSQRIILLISMIRMLTLIRVGMDDGSLYYFLRELKNMELKVEGGKMELLTFIASLEANRKKGSQRVVQIDGKEAARGEEAFL